MLVVGGEFVEWGGGGDPSGFGAAEEVLLAFAVGGTLEGLDEPVADGEGFVREGSVEIDADDAAEAAAVRAGSEGIIEGEEGWGGLTDFEVAGSAVPAAGEAEGSVRRSGDEGELALAEGEGGFEGFGEP